MRDHPSVTQRAEHPEVGRLEFGTEFLPAPGAGPAASRVHRRASALAPEQADLEGTAPLYGEAASWVWLMSRALVAPLPLMCVGLAAGTGQHRQAASYQALPAVRNGEVRAVRAWLARKAL